MTRSSATRDCVAEIAAIFATAYLRTLTRTTSPYTSQADDLAEQPREESESEQSRVQRGTNPARKDEIAWTDNTTRDGSSSPTAAQSGAPSGRTRRTSERTRGVKTGGAR